ncbi:hypothetical protein [Culicoidibacter larvae]|uniref:Uncharacterized protein n=1 Tax=Culicoidibacter larvae TaxID=2579976 RepID=A0A5R8QF76_9FIRM|nr:hypothetical protein [Culicoidibacter larvae]TLG76691.1 hypothetical protein FEZ08_03495 [Culicoidibacter larvae]
MVDLKQYEISRFNPDEFNNEGRYIGEYKIFDNIQEIGNIYNGKIVSKNDFKLIENKFLKCLELIINEQEVNEFFPLKLDNYKDYQFLAGYFSECDDSIISTIENLSLNSTLSKKDVLQICCGICRQALESGFYSKNKYFVFRVWDNFFLKLSCVELSKELVSKINELGFYIKVCSPQE